MPKEGLHKEEIKAMVRKRGYTMVSLGAKMGVPGATLRSSFCKPHPAANKIVADLLGMKLHALWPAWYDRHGNRTSHPKNLTKQRRRHCQKSPRKSA